MRFLSVLCIGLWGVTVLAAPMSESMVTDHVQLGVKTWFSQGSDEWEISFDDFLGDYYYQGCSRLEWEKMDGTIPVLFGEIRFTSWLRLGGSYGSSDSSGGENTDTDWLDAPDLGYYNQVISQSIADTEGDTTFYDINLYFRLNRLLTVYPKNIKGTLDGYFGYQSYKDKLNDHNGVQTADLDGNTINEPFDGLDSTFDFDWSAVRLGLRGEYPILDCLLVKGDAALLTGAKYEGEGFWNLRSDMKPTPPNFTQEADAGSGYDIKLGVAYKPIPYVTIEAGYWFFSLSASDGTETTYYAKDVYDVDESTESLDDAKSTRDGFYVALSGNF